MDKIVMRGPFGEVQVNRDHFILLHDYFSSVLNTARQMERESEEGITMEEHAGRILMVTVAMMNDWVEANPDALEEMVVSLEMGEKAKAPKNYNDAMFG